MRCSAHIDKPIKEGIAKNITNFWDFFSCSLYKFRSPFWFALDKDGNNTVPIAIANIPSGNCINLSETYNQVGLPVIKSDAKIVSINKLIWATPPAISAGSIRTKTFFIPLLLKSIFGTGSLLIWDKGASWINNWINPAKRTPHAKPIIGIEKSGASTNAERIIHTLKTMGVAAGNEYFLC